MADVLFDVDGVLVHGYHAKSAFSRHWDDHLEVDFGISRTDFRDRFIRAIFEPEVLTGRLRLLDALKQVLPTLGHAGDPQKLIDYWMERDAALTPGLLPYVERLHTFPNVRLFLATNQESVRANYLMNTMGLGKYFKDIFNSARLGVLKPDPRFFERVERLLDRPEKPTFFDDRENVVEAARLAGWDAHQFDQPEDLRKSRIIASLLDCSQR